MIRSKQSASERRALTLLTANQTAHSVSRASSSVPVANPQCAFVNEEKLPAPLLSLTPAHRMMCASPTSSPHMLTGSRRASILEIEEAKEENGLSAYDGRTRHGDESGTDQHRIAIPRLGIKCFLPLSPTRTSYVLT